MFRVEISDIAALELTDAFDWYESREEGLGQRLLNEFDAVLATLHERPLMHRIVEGATRRALLASFPMVSSSRSSMKRWSSPPSSTRAVILIGDWTASPEIVRDA
ncbi:MAG: hypothetical protein RMA76_03015 [Deltaproteobacteria bacterium]